jgi:catechol 2,3-dioxygenase-like lactoylglutathione lyase family enzyme
MKSLFIYPVVILLVLYMSGVNKEMTFYKKHLITLYGTTVYSHSINTSKQFYSNLLDLPLLEETPEYLVFRLPDNRKITVLAEDGKTSNKPAKEVLTIRVRNGLPKLHESFRKNVEEKFKSNESLVNVSVSDLQQTARGREFHLTDPSGNQITFFQRFLFSSK